MRSFFDLEGGFLDELTLCAISGQTDSMAIKDSIFIKTDARFKDVTYEKGGDSWYLNFDNDISFSLYTDWRLFVDDVLTLISNDHGHQFGLPQPVDIISDLKKYLDGTALKEIKIEKNTGDLFLTFNQNIKVTVNISSMGYESYEVFADNRQFVAQGGGDIAIFELNKIRHSDQT